MGKRFYLRTRVISPAVRNAFSEHSRSILMNVYPSNIGTCRCLGLTTTMNGSIPYDDPPPPPPSSSEHPSLLPPPPPPPNEILPPPPPDDAPPPPPPSILPTKQKAGWGSHRSRDPLSIEEILKNKKEADAAAAKVSSTCSQHFGDQTSSVMLTLYSLEFILTRVAITV
jgi:hypothetical protein